MTSKHIPERKAADRSIISHVMDHINLMRVRQWYKNLVIFLAIFFSGNILKTDMLIPTMIGFAALCLISSANYIINDIIDMKSDRNHPEKRHRPLASGRISIAEAVISAIILVSLAGIISYNIGTLFFISIIILFCLTTAYSLFLKDEPVLDILLIAANLVIRTVAGVLIIDVYMSPWLVLCPFFAAIFLAVAKREADLKLLEDKAFTHKKVLKFYSKKITDSMMDIAAACVIISYALYALSKTSLMLLTIPFAVYTIFRYYALALEGSEIVRSPENIYKDIRLMLSLMLWSIVLIMIRYILENNLFKYV